MGVPIYNVVEFLWEEARKESITERANAIAFSFMLAMFPFTIVLLTLLPYMPIDNYVEMTDEYLAVILPKDVHKQVMDAVFYVLKPRNSLMSFGFLLTIFFSSNGIMALMRGFDKDYQMSFVTRTGWQKRMVAIKLTLILGSLFIMSMFLIIVGNFLIAWLVDHIKADMVTQFAIYLLRWLVVVFLFYTGISIIYIYGPAMRRRFHFFSPGATLATIMAILASLGLSFFINTFKKNIYEDVYGSSFATLIAFMLWMQLMASSLIVGFELNTSIAVNRALMREEKESQQEQTEGAR